MVSTSGSQLLDKEAVGLLSKRLLPLATLVTPNLPEAKLLLETEGIPFKDPECVDDIVQMAKAIQHFGPKYVLLKGGHLPLTRDRLVSKQEADNDIVLNVLCGEGEIVLMETDFLESKNTHGTGCSLACEFRPLFPCGLYTNMISIPPLAAIASNLALGVNMVNAVKNANKYVEAGIKSSISLGKGFGPINHFHSTYTLPFAP